MLAIPVSSFAFVHFFIKVPGVCERGGLALDRIGFALQFAIGSIRKNLIAIFAYLVPIRNRSYCGELIPSR
jgi:hypothetical protein